MANTALLESVQQFRTGFVNLGISTSTIDRPRPKLKSAGNILVIKSAGGVVLNAEQQSFVDGFYSWFCDREGGQYAVLDGGAGVGKSFSLVQGLKRLSLRAGEVILCAPTVQAAFVLAAILSEAGLPNFECKTIHSLYGVKAVGHEEDGSPIFRCTGIDKRKFEKLRLILIDERSMISESLLDVVQENTPKHIRVMLTGDGHQLPPVEKSEDSDRQVLDIETYNAGAFPDPITLSPSLVIDDAPLWELRKIMRQDGGNAVKVGTALREMVDASDAHLPEVFAGQEAYGYKCSLASIVNDIGYDDSIQKTDSVKSLYDGIVSEFRDGRAAKFLAWTNRSVSAATKAIFSELHPDAEHDFPVGAYIKLDEHWRNGGDAMIMPSGSEGFVHSVSISSVSMLGSEIEVYSLVIDFGKDNLQPMAAPTVKGAKELKRLQSMLLGVKGGSGTRILETDLLRSVEAKLSLEHSDASPMTIISELILPKRYPDEKLVKAAKDFQEYLDWKMVSFDNKTAWTLYYSVSSHFAKLQHGYASTIHKSQGSTYRKVYVCNDIASFRLSEWNCDGESYSRKVAGCDPRLAFRLLYVAMTRHKESVVFYERP